jgi:hypothetical protein
MAGRPGAEQPLKQGLVQRTTAAAVWRRRTFRQLENTCRYSFASAARPSDAPPAEARDVASATA